MHPAIALDPSSTAARDSTAITLLNVTATHGNDRAVDGVSLAIMRGAVTVIAGPNGSGKSTLLNVLAGLHDIRSGEIVRHTTGRTAIVVQRSGLPERLPMTVGDAVTMGSWAGRGLWRRARRSDRSTVARCIRDLALDGLEHRSLHSLSGGQRQRVLVAQGLAQQADLLLLDEPMNGVDAETQERIESVIDSEAQRGVTVVHVSHDTSVIARARRVIRLEAGRLVQPTERQARRQ